MGKRKVQSGSLSGLTFAASLLEKAIGTKIAEARPRSSLYLCGNDIILALEDKWSLGFHDNKI